MREIAKRLLAQLDIPNGLFETKAFQLKYAHPDRIKERIESAYERPANEPREAVRVISYPTMKQVVVIASPENLSRIAEQIAEWDVFQVAKPRIIELQNSDPVQMARLLTALFAEEDGEGVNISDLIFGEGAQERYDITGPLSSHFKFEEVPETNKILVISNVSGAYEAVVQWINEIDKQKMATKDIKQVREWMAGLVREDRLRASKSVDDVEQPTDNKVTISGQCRDSGGRPLTNAQVLVYCEDYDRRTMKQIAEGRTDSEGHFSLGSIPPLSEEDHGRRRYLVFVPADGHGPAWKEVNLYQESVERLELRAYNSAVVTGSVVTEDSKPVADGQVWVRGIISGQATEETLSADNHFFIREPLPGWSATTDSDGSFHISGVLEGTRIQLSVSHRSFAECIVHVKPAAPAKIEVQPGATITGRVLYGATGKPAAGVMVQAQGVEHIPTAGGWMAGWAETVTDEQGRYRLESLYGAKYNVWAEAENLTVVALDSFEATAGQTKAAPDLVLVEGGFIVGRVIDKATGKPIKPGEYSDIAIYGPSRPKSGAAVETSDIRDDGSFRIRVAPGRNYIYLRPLGDWGRGKAVVNPASQWVTVAEDETAEVEFKIRKFSQEELNAEAERHKRGSIRIQVPKTLDELEQREENQSKDASVRKDYDVSDLLGTGIQPGDLGGYITDHVEPESWYALNKAARGMITIYPGGQANKIAIVQTPENHSKIERLLEELRRFPDELIKAKTQILIETRILTAGDAFMKHIGLDPNSPARSEGWSEHAVHTSGDSSSFVIDPLHADLLLKTAAVHKDTKMLAAPQVMAMVGKEVKIQIRDSKAGHYYMLTPSIEPNAASGQAESTSTQIELGTTVRLTPHVTPNGKNVELDFDWERRRLLGFKEHTGPDKQTQKVPQIAFDSIRTQCPVPDGKTLLIAGKRIIDRVETLSKTPLLGDLPLIGSLFTSSRPVIIEDTTNLLILVKPVINPSKRAQAPLKFEPAPPLDPGDPLVKKLEEKLEHSDEVMTNH